MREKLQNSSSLKQEKYLQMKKNFWCNILKANENK